MKVVAGILGVLVIVGLLIAMPLVEPIECVCIDGALATCFNPGP
jgi:hypothetical protein